MPKLKKHWQFACDFETTTKQIEPLTTGFIYCISSCLITSANENYTDTNPFVIVKQPYDKNYDYFKNYLDKLLDLTKAKTTKNGHSFHDTFELWFVNCVKFDSYFIKAWLFKNGFRNLFAETLSRKLKNNEFVLLGSGENFKHLVIKFIYKNNVFIVRDLIKLTTLSVAKMGELLNLPKLKNEIDIANFDYTKKSSDWKTLIKYAKRDVEIIRDYFYTLNKNLKNDWSKSLTAPALAMRDLKKWLGPKATVLKIPNNPELRGLYYGGFTNFNYLYQGITLNQKIYYYDLNSAYPWAMCQPLPFSKEMFEKRISINDAKFMKILIKKAVLKPNHIPCLFAYLKHKQENFVYKENVERFYWFFEKEWELIKSQYDLEFEILESYFVPLKPFLKDYIERLYEKRANAKKANDKVLANYIKLLLNSIYGKFGQKPLFDNSLYVPIEFKLNDTISDGESDYYIKRVGSLGYDTPHGFLNHYYIENLTQPQTCNNVIIASYITSLVRCRILETILHVGFKNWIYTDTDSLMSLKPFANHLIDNYKLGFWKLEATYEYALIYGAKRYLLSHDYKLNDDSKVVVSGVSNWDKLKGLPINTKKYFANDIFSKTTTIKTASGVLIETTPHQEKTLPLIKEKYPFLNIML